MKKLCSLLSAEDDVRVIPVRSRGHVHVLDYAILAEPLLQLLLELWREILDRHLDIRLEGHLLALVLRIIRIPNLPRPRHVASTMRVARLCESGVSEVATEAPGEVPLQISGVRLYTS